MPSLKDISDFRQNLMDFATGRSEFDPYEFTTARQSLITDISLKDYIPDFVKKCRSPQDFWDYIKSKHSDYAGRRNEIREAFDPLLEHLELGIADEPKSLSLNKAFISYSNLDKEIAGRIKAVLRNYAIESFMAHDDIEVSQVWMSRILSEVQDCGIFICLLSKNFLSSHFCLQETGIASSITGLCVVPLSIDGTTPPGFLNKFQSAKISSESISIDDMVPAFLERSQAFGIDIALLALENSGAYRVAETRAQRVIPYLDRMTLDQTKRLINSCRTNSQIYDASLCANTFFPIIVSKFAKFMSEDAIKFFNLKIEQYSL